MQGGRGRDDPFANFLGMPDPFPGMYIFEDPMFTNPMGELLQPSPFGRAASPFMGLNPFDQAGSPFMGLSPFGHGGSPFMGVSPFGSSLFGPNGSPFMDAHAPGIHDHGQLLPCSSRGPVIEELSSDDTDDEPEAGHSGNDNPHMPGRSAGQPYVQQTYDGSQGRQLSQTPYGKQFSVMHDTHSRPQAQSFSFQSSTVTYGGSDGAYYTSSTTRRAGSDGLTFEEHKEADSLTGRAAHRVSRGIQDKGHTLSRHLKSDGQVDTMQTLHNINEDELTGFEEVWEGKARKHLPSWMVGTNAHNVRLEGSGEATRGGGWALPSTENTHTGGRRRPGADEHGQSSKVLRH